LQQMDLGLRFYLTQKPQSYDVSKILLKPFPKPFHSII